MQGTSLCNVRDGLYYTGIASYTRYRHSSCLRFCLFSSTTGSAALYTFIAKGVFIDYKMGALDFAVQIGKKCWSMSTHKMFDPIPYIHKKNEK